MRWDTERGLGEVKLLFFNELSRADINLSCQPPPVSGSRGWHWYETAHTRTQRARYCVGWNSEFWSKPEPLRNRTVPHRVQLLQVRPFRQRVLPM